MGVIRVGITMAFYAAMSGCAAAVMVPSDVQTCGAARLSGWIGQPASALDDQYLPQTVRLVRPDDAVTEDHNPGRLNVYLDGSDHILRFRCG